MVVVVGTAGGGTIFKDRVDARRRCDSGYARIEKRV